MPAMCPLLPLTRPCASRTPARLAAAVARQNNCDASDLTRGCAPVRCRRVRARIGPGAAASAQIYVPDHGAAAVAALVCAWPMPS